MRGCGTRGALCAGCLPSCPTTMYALWVRREVLRTLFCPAQRLLALHLPAAPCCALLHEIFALWQPSRHHGGLHRSAMDEFVLPDNPEQLWAPDGEHPGQRCEAWVDMAEADPAEVGEVAESEWARLGCCVGLSTGSDSPKQRGAAAG